jgi:hypothetical protein
MKLIDVLRVVRGAVSSKDLVPILTHLAFKDGCITSFDGGMSIEVPCDDIAYLSCTVPSDRFIAAIEACGDSVPVIAIEGSTLHVSTPTIQIKMPIGDVNDFPFNAAPSVSRLRVIPSFINVLKALRPFIGNDASRPWASGLLFRDSIAAATNNVVIAVKELARNVPQEFILPAFAVDELLRIGEQPKAYMIEDHRVIFYLPSDIVFTARVIDDAWPKSPTVLVDELSEGASFLPIPEGLCTGIEQLIPFVADVKTPIVEFENTIVRTLDAEVQGTLSGFENLGSCRFRAEPLITTLHSAAYADFSRFPRIPWRGADETLRGVLVGMMR